MKKSSDRSKADTRVRPKRSTDRQEAKLPVSKKKKNSRKMGASKSQIDLEELLAQTYPKEPSVLGDETRRSKELEKPSDPAENWAKNLSQEDEIKLANGLRESCRGDQMDMAAFYERAKEIFPSVSHAQLYEKMTQMRSMFWTIESNLRDEKIAEDYYLCMCRHDRELYYIWKGIWGHHERTETVQDMEMEQNRELQSRSHAKQVHNEDANEDDHKRRIEVAQSKEIEQKGESYAHVMEAHNVEFKEEPSEKEEEEEHWHAKEEEEHWHAEEEKEDGQPTGKAATRTTWNHDAESNLVQKETEDLVHKVQTNVHNEAANEDGHKRRIEVAQSKEMERKGESYAHVMEAHNVEFNEEPSEKEEEEEHWHAKEEEKHWHAEEEKEDGQPTGKAATRTTWNHDAESNLIQKETEDLVHKVQINVRTMLDDTQAKMEGLVDNLIKRASAAAQVQSLGSEIEIGTCVCTSLSRRMTELQGVRSFREFSGLAEAEARQLKQKWRKHKMEELRIFSDRLALLKEECKLCIKDMEITSGTHSS